MSLDASGQAHTTGERVAIVTGVSRGLGAAIANHLIDRGFAVLAIGRTRNEALAGDRYEFVQVDLAEASSAEPLLDSAFRDIAVRRPKSVCLLNNAGTNEPFGVIGELSANEIAGAIATNLTAAVTLANLFCRVFSEPELPRRIINISSGAAERALPGEAVYCIAKAGLEMLTRALAAEQTGSTFQAVTLRPGVIDTDMQSLTRSQPPEALPVVDLFKRLHREGLLLPPDVVATRIVDELVLGEVDDGRTYMY